MIKKSILALLLAVSGCSAYVNTSAVFLDCQTEKEDCPEQEEVYRMAVTFESCTPFDVSKEMIVHWYDSDKHWENAYTKSGFAIGYTDWNMRDIFVTSFGVMAHEMMHVNLGRIYGDMDVNHADPVGPWTNHDDEIINEVRTQFDNLTECE